MQTINIDEESIKCRWSQIDSELDEVIARLKNYGRSVGDNLADYVSALCDVDKKELLSSNNSLYVAQARWMYWYAYRYMTNDTYEKIAQHSSLLSKHRFTKTGVAASVNKMAGLIENEPIWKKRWSIIKRIIKIHNQEETNTNNTITINIPKELKEQIKIEIKEK